MRDRNGEMGMVGIGKLVGLRNKREKEIELVGCGSGRGDEIVGCDGCMVDGVWEEGVEILCCGGVCVCCVEGVKIGYLRIGG